MAKPGAAVEVGGGTCTIREWSSNVVTVISGLESAPQYRPHPHEFIKSSVDELHRELDAYSHQKKSFFFWCVTLRPLVVYTSVWAARFIIIIIIMSEKVAANSPGNTVRRVKVLRMQQ